MVEVGKEPVAIPGGPFRQVGDEGLDLFAGGVAEVFCGTELGRVALDQAGIELVLADELAEAIAQAGLTIPRTFFVGRVTGEGVFRFGIDRRSEGSQFFDRAEADAVSLAQGAVDSPGFRHAHLGTADQGRDVRGVSVAVADEAARTG